MSEKCFVVMGAGEVGFHLAKSLSQQGHDVAVIELDPVKQERIEDELDVLVVGGNGAHPKVLEAAGVGNCELFMAVSSSDEANLAAANIAKFLGAERTVVRVGIAEEVITDRRLLEDVFLVDLLLSTQLLTTIRVLNEIRGHNTVAVEYLAWGKIQLSKVHLDEDSPLVRKPLKDVSLPKDCLVVAFFSGDELIVPAGDDRAAPGDDALLLGTTEVIGEAELVVSSARKKKTGTVVIGGGGATGRSVARALVPFDARVKIIEKDRARAKELAATFPGFEIIHGDMTDLSLLQSERVSQAETFVALSGNDESNLMASLMAQELGVDQVLAMVHRTETTQLWERLGLKQVFSPRLLAYERIQEYIDSGYSANIVTLQKGAAQVFERRLAEASPAAGVTLAEMNPPRGLIVGAVKRGDRVFVPHGNDRLEVGDLVYLFVHEDEVDTARLLFPGRDTRKQTPVTALR
ncbi:MAG: Trk system potassium transporter TrkA [Thermoanaerobaculia bacterium]